MVLFDGLNDNDAKTRVIAMYHVEAIPCGMYNWHDIAFFVAQGLSSYLTS